MRKIIATLIATLAALTLSAGIATAAPGAASNADRYHGNAEHSDCRASEKTYTRYLIRVRNADDTGWNTTTTRALPADDSGIVFEVISARTVTDRFCEYPTN